eukprot:634419-Pyramimonas_sp.AAC.1
MAFWHDSRSSECTSQVGPCRWNPESNVLACFRVFKLFFQRGSSPNGNEPLYGAYEGELGGRVHSNI